MEFEQLNIFESKQILNGVVFDGTPKQMKQLEIEAMPNWWQLLDGTTVQSGLDYYRQVVNHGFEYFKLGDVINERKI